MKISILALGSTGDVLPMIMLGKALAARGHQVQVGTFENFAPDVHASGLAYIKIRGDARALLKSASGRGIAEAGQNVIRMATSVMRTFGSLAANYAQDLTALAYQGNDLVINQLPGGLYGRSLAEKLGIPEILASVIPLTPTASQPMLAFPQAFARVPGYNLLSHKLAYQIVWQGFRLVINRWRRKDLGLGTAPFWGYFQDNWKNTQVLNGFSSHVINRPKDWGDNIKLTGYWFPEAADWTPDNRLRRFLRAGPPPVFLGFGSMPVADKNKTLQTLVNSLRKTGKRGLLHTGWGGLAAESLPEDVLMVDYIPYDWLFPQMAALVHHGGSGTTAFALRAGVPMTIVPFTFDQFYWGARIHALGVGPRPIPFQQLSTERLTAAIEQSAGDIQMRNQAVELGYKIQAEDGVGAAVEAIESYISSKSGPIL